MKINFLLFILILLNLSCESKSKDKFENIKTKKTESVDANNESTKDFKIDLQEKVITDLPERIEGIYKHVGTEYGSKPCNLTLTITKKNGQYYYNLKSDLRNLNGKVSLYRSLEENETSIMLEGIEWAEYRGEISNEDDENYQEKELELPIGINGSFVENEITIQNYGNSMNYYLKLNDCGEKFIRLKK